MDQNIVTVKGLLPHCITDRRIILFIMHNEAAKLESMIDRAWNIATEGGKLRPQPTPRRPRVDILMAAATNMECRSTGRTAEHCHAVLVTFATNPR